MTKNQTYPELEQARTDMRTQSELYQPSVFWNEASAHIVSELEQYGVENFRSLQYALWFYAPTYGVPGNSYVQEQIDALKAVLNENHHFARKAKMALEQFLDGETSALADYRVLLAADDTSRLPYLHQFSESTAGKPAEHFEFDGRHFSRSALNYLLGLALLKKHLPENDAPKNVLEIGGGFGTLGEILASSGIQDLRYIDIDIPPTSFVAQHYLTAVLGNANVATYTSTHLQEIISIDSLPMASVLCSWQIEKLVGKIDLFVNFISFQEMEPVIVKNYLSQVERLGARWILLRNMREGKQKRTADHLAGVETPILSDDYLSMLPGYELVERNVHPFGYRTVDWFHSELLLLRKKS